MVEAGRLLPHLPPAAFKDTTGNGMGDLQGIIQRLDYLQELGVNALWTLSVFPLPRWPTGATTSAITPTSTPTWAAWTAWTGCWKPPTDSGLRVLLDFVPNHTSDQHAWFRQSRSGRAAARKRDWYIWRDPAPGGGPPNNWIGYFGAPAWECDLATRQYYLHSFLKEQPDLNWRNPQVRQAMQLVLQFWLDRGVDGFRVDAVSSGH